MGGISIAALRAARFELSLGAVRRLAAAPLAREGREDLGRGEP